jgi:hypothetical protein
MNSTTSAIYDILQADLTLLNLLATNTPFYSPSGSTSKANSIVPAGQISGKFNTPFVSLQEGNLTLISEKLKDESFYVRCYNDINKTGVAINNILDRIIELLDRVELNIVDEKHRFVKIKWESRLPLLVDEGFNLNFREDRYRLFIL